MREQMLDLGVVVTAPSAEYDSGVLDFGPYLDRHRSGDWGEVDPEQAERNREALRSGGSPTSVISLYSLLDGSQLKIMTISGELTHIQWLEAEQRAVLIA